MKNLSKFIIVAALGCMAMGTNAQEKQDWGDFKLWIDPGHSGRENQGLYGYSEAEKVLAVGLATREYLFEYTTATPELIKMTREDQNTVVGLQERSALANAWGADFFYSIHSDAGDPPRNTTVFLFGGWKKNGEYIEKTPHGGKAYGDILCPNLTGVMYDTGTRGNYYDRVFYNGDVETHDNQYPYLSVNRESNMASLLSEGGYHTLPMQQSLNMNVSYKRLEAFGTFRSIMEYRGLARPEKVMLAGVIKNSENQQPINGVTVTVDGKEIVTDTYESLFSKYTKNPDMVHNGFFLYEGLTPGGTYEVTYSCPGYTSASQTVTLNSDPQGLSGDNVTWANIELTSNNPAVVSANNVADPDNVNTRKPIVLTFSRNMDRATVEQAFSMSDNGQVALSWDNDYTLRIDISQLRDEWLYTLRIDGTIAKNSQTQQFLDGNNDGQEGGDYVFQFATMEADVVNPYVKSTTPADGKTMLYTMRPPIRVEFNEELVWNEDDAADAIVLMDADGNKVDGTITHAVVNEASVLHLYPSADLQRDKCYKVTVAGGFEDLVGNVSEPYEFRFLSEYRPILDSQNMDDAEQGIVLGHWWDTEGSGSTVGTTDKTGKTEGECYFELSNIHSRADVGNTAHIRYQWDDEATSWLIREYRNYAQSGFLSKYIGYVLQAAVYGDGSNNLISHGVRASSAGIVRNPEMELNFRGWDVMAWDISNSGDNVLHLTGEGPMGPTETWRYDAFYVRHTQSLDEQEEIIDNDGMDDDGNIVPLQAWEGDILFDDYKYVKYDETAEQTASIDDIPLEEPQAPYYLVGTFNDWNQMEGQGRKDFIADENGNLEVTDNFEANAKFKIITPAKADESEWTWIGGVSEGDFVITEEQIENATELSLAIPGEDFLLPVAGNYTLRIVKAATPSGGPRRIVNADEMKLVVVRNNITGVEEFNVSDVAAVRYVNMAGQVSAAPFTGVNLKVVTMNDGTTQVVKVVR